MTILQRKTKGVTLLEVLLVLAIASSLLVLILNYTTQKSDELRRDKTVLQMQQILNAGMSFYTNQSFWPLKDATITNTLCGQPSKSWTDISMLQSNNYLPSPLKNSYGKDYQLNCNNALNGGGFFVATQTNNPTNAAIIAGRLPLAYRTNSLTTFPATSCTSGNDCTYVVTTVNIPGQNLNNARSVNFAAVYHSGSCVPAPNCPPNMKADILVMPAAVSGVNDSSTTTTYPSYPVNSFTAYALGNPKAPDPTLPIDPNPGPVGCVSLVTERCVADQSGTYIPSDGTLYWRVCLSVVTGNGTVNPTSVDQGKAMGSVVAMTRCVPNMGKENPSGSIDVWQP